METKKILVASYEEILSPKKDENEDRSYINWNGEPICECCGRRIKDINNAKQLHVIGSNKFFTEDETDFGEYDMGWYFVGKSCYQKYLKTRFEIEIEIK